MMDKKLMVLALIAAFLIGGWAGDESRPKPDRPVARFIGKIARLGLWILVLGEPQPKAEPQFTKSSPDHIDHMRSL